MTCAHLHSAAWTLCGRMRGFASTTVSSGQGAIVSQAGRCYLTLCIAELSLIFCEHERVTP